MTARVLVRRTTRAVLYLLIVAGAGLTAPLVYARDAKAAEDAAPRALASRAAERKQPPIHGKLDAILNDLLEAFERTDRSPSAAGAVAKRAPLRSGSLVAVSFRTRSTAGSQALARWLRANDGEPRNLGEDYVEAYVHMALLPAASGRREVVRARAIVPPLPKRGQVTSEGASAHAAQRWHSAGFRAAGVKVGVIDVGFQDIAKSMGSELPAAITGRCYRTVGDYSSALADCDTDERHGTEVAEALADIAPDAALYVANPISNADLLATVDWMVAEGVKVINYSVGHVWDGPGDGTSPYSDSPLRSVDRAVRGGAVWANAAGNEGRSAWHGAFNDADGDGFHEFGAGQECNVVGVEEGGFIRAQLRWQGAWSGDAPLADLDLYLYETESGIYDPESPVAASALFQNGPDAETPGSGTPSELMVFESAGREYCLTVQRYVDDDFAAPAPGWIQLIDHTSNELQLTRGGSIGNPAESANRGLLAVGAAFWKTPTDIASYSSRGPTPDGRSKPDIVGVDGAQSSFAPHFFGTSQASPHVAGLVALVASRWPRLSATKTADYLRYHAERRARADVNAWGSGLAVLPSPTIVDRQLPAGEDLRLSLAAMFPDFAGDVRYVAHSSADSVRVAVSGGLLRIDVADEAQADATITVTATQGGRSASVRFQITLQAEAGHMSLWRRLLPAIVEPNAR